jgi:hypothetical protein
VGTSGGGRGKGEDEGGVEHDRNALYTAMKIE